MSKSMRNGRERRIERIRQRLLRKSMPRLVVTLLLSMTALSAFLTSFMLLWLGVLKMWVRYPFAILVAYFLFLLLLAVWIWLQRGSLDPDVGVLEAIPTDFGPAHEHDLDLGDAGDLGGGGSGGDWTTGVSSARQAVSSGDTSLSSADLLDLDLGEGCLIVVAVVAIIGGLIASFYVIYIAPALLAEILLDGVLAAGLYRRVKGIDKRHWLHAAVRRTALPAFLTLVFFTGAAYLLQRAIPDAHTIGEVWTHLTNR